MFAAASFELLEARAHLGVAEQLRQFLVDWIDRLGMGRRHTAIVPAPDIPSPQGMRPSSETSGRQASVHECTLKVWTDQWGWFG